MSDVLGNPILLMSVLANLTSAKDIASICVLNHNIRSTALSILPFSGVTRLSFNNQTNLKGKDLLTLPFTILTWKDLAILNLSRTSIGSNVVRSLLRESNSLKVLQIVECRKVDCGTLLSLLRHMYKIRYGKREDKRNLFAPICVLDCWGVSGLSLDYKYQNKQEWLYESCCADNKNLRLLLFEAELLGIDLNINFCQSPDHDTITDVRYHPAARQMCGLSPCSLFAREDYDVSYCDTCILRNHNRQGNPKHKCRTPEPVPLLHCA